MLMVSIIPLAPRFTSPSPDHTDEWRIRCGHVVEGHLASNRRTWVQVSAGSSLAGWPGCFTDVWHCEGLYVVSLLL